MLSFNFGRRATRIALVFLGLWAPATLLAGPMEDAELLVRKGNDLRKAGDDEGALPLFREAFELYRSPRTTAQLGLVERALGRWVEADDHLTDALKAVQTDAWIRTNRDTLEESLRIAKRNVGRVEITGEPAGAEVLVNGRVVGKVPLPQPVRVIAGSVDIELRAPGHRSSFRTISVAGLQYQPVVIRLDKEGDQPRPGAGGLLPVQRSTGLGAAKGGYQADVVEGAGLAPWRKTAIVAALGGVGLGLGAGGYGLWRHNVSVDAFNDRCLATANGAILIATRTADKRCTELRSAFETARTVTIVGFSAAGALGITALVLYLTGTGTGSTDRASASRISPLACAPDLGRSGLLCSLSF